MQNVSWSALLQLFFYFGYNPPKTLTKSLWSAVYDVFVLWNLKYLHRKEWSYSQLKSLIPFWWKTKWRLLFFRIFKAAMRQINSLLRGAREGTKNLLYGCKSAWKSSQNSNKQTTWRQVKLVIYSKAFQISRLSIQQFVLGQIFIFRPLNKISIFA